MVSAVLAIIIVNGVHKLLMHLVGASFMFFDWKKKIAWYVIAWAILMGIIGI